MRKVIKVYDTRSRVFEFNSKQEVDFLFGEFGEFTAGVVLFELFEIIDTLFDGFEVGEQAGDPFVRDVGHATCNGCFL